MAASITGTFRIIDRASGPMKKMERQAIKTMAAIEALGKAVDKSGSGSGASSGGGAASGGASTAATQKMEKTARAVRNVGREAKVTEQSLGGMGGALGDADRKSGGLIAKLGRLGSAFLGVKAIMMVFKVALLGVGVTALVQGIGVLIGGLVALVPAVSRATGALAALPAVIGAAVQGMAAFKLASGGVAEAVKAGTQMQKNAGRTARDMGDQQRQAANSIRQAERGVQMSQRASRDAQIALSTARRQGIRELTDLRLAAEGAALGEQGASIALKRAKSALATGAIDPGTSFTDLEDLQLGVREAQLNLRRSKIDNRRARSDSKRGPQTVGRQVRSAREGVADAAYEQGEAIRALGEAQRQANRIMQDGSSDAQNFKDALSELSPEAQSFARKLIGLKGVMKDLRASAGRKLFPDLETAIDSGLKLLPVLNRGLERTGAVIGRNVKGLAASASTPSGQADTAALMDHQASVLDRMFKVVRNLGAAFVDLALAARPFTNWLTRAVVNWSEYVKRTTDAARITGRLADFLEGAKTSLQRFGRILGNSWGAMKALSAAAAPLGERLWNGAERATQGWETYLTSVEGSVRAQAWFDKLYEPLHELGQLSVDIVKAWARITVDPAFVQTVKALRESVPSLERLMFSLSSLGPDAAAALEQMVRLLANLPINPITLLLKALTKVLDLLNDLIERVPKLGIVLSGVFSALLVAKVGRLLGKLTLVAGAFRAIRAAAAGAAGVTAAGAAGAGAAGAAAGAGAGAAAKKGLFRRVLGRVAGGEAASAASTAGRMTGGRLAAGALGLTGGAALAGRLVRGVRDYRGYRAMGDVGRREAFNTARMDGAAARAAASRAQNAGFLAKYARVGGTAAKFGKFASGPLGLAAGVGASYAGSKIGGWEGGALSGAGIGMGIGAGVGSVVPVVGTAVGALVGAGVGGLVGALTATSKAEQKAAREMEEFGKTADSTFSDLIRFNDSRGLKRFADDAERLGKTAKGPAKDGLRQLAGMARLARTRVVDMKLANAMQLDLGRVSTVSGRGVSRILKRFDRLSPEGRVKAKRMLLAMAASMEANGQIATGSTAKLRRRITRELNALASNARAKTKRMLDAIKSTLLNGIPGLGRIGSLVAAATSPKVAAAITKDTGLSPRELLRREVLRQNPDNPNGGISALLAPKTKAQKREAGRVVLQGRGQLKNFQERMMPAGTYTPGRLGAKDSLTRKVLEANNRAFVSSGRVQRTESDKNEEEGVEGLVGSGAEPALEREQVEVGRDGVGVGDKVGAERDVERDQVERDVEGAEHALGYEVGVRRDAVGRHGEADGPVGVLAGRGEEPAGGPERLGQGRCAGGERRQGRSAPERQGWAYPRRRAHGHGAGRPARHRCAW